MQTVHSLHPANLIMKDFFIPIWEDFKVLPAVPQIIILLGLLILFVAISSASAGIERFFANKRYEAREAARMKIVQAALVEAESAKLAAFALEQSATEDKRRINAKEVKTIEADQARQKEKEQRDNDIQEFSQSELDKINNDADLCTRCHDICQRAARISSNNPADNPGFGSIQCSNDSCAEVCASK